MNTIAGIMLDFDGTLADSLSVMKAAYESFLSTNLITEGKIPFSDLNGPPLINIIQTLRSKYNIEASEETLLNEYIDNIAHLYSEVLPSKGAKDLLNFAYKNNIKIVIVTSNNRTLVKKWLSHNSLDKYIFAIVGSEDVIKGKPDPEPYLIATKLIGCLAEEAIAIEDSYQGALSAISADIKTYLIQSDDSFKMKDNKIFREFIMIPDLHSVISSINKKNIFTSCLEA